MTRENLLLIALQSGALFLALWGIFRLIPSIPANAKAWMWRLAFLKPLLSLLPFAVVTLPILPATAPAPISTPISMPAATNFVDITSASASTPIMPVAEPTAYSESLVPVAASEPALNIDPLLAGWYLGVVLVAVYGLRGMYRSLRAVRQAENVERADLQLALGELLAKAHVRKPTRLLSSDRIQSAMLVGGRSYNILLPQDAIENGSFQDLRLMLAHEVAHIARRDLVWFGVTSAVQSLFFFNPMVWIAARCSRLDHESATDRHASQLAGVPVQTYAEMLLRATVVARPSLVPGSLPMAESYRTIHRRLEAMKHFNTKPTLWRKTATAALAMLTLSLLPAYELAAAAYPDDFYPEDQSLYAQASTQVANPAVTVSQVKAAKAAKGSTATQYITVPVKVVVGKDKKVRYYVWTKKGYAEVNGKDLQGKKVAKGTIYVTQASVAKQVSTKSTDPTVKATKKAQVSNPIRAIAGNPQSQGASGVAVTTSITTTNLVATGQAVVADPTKATVATTLGQQTVTANRPATTRTLIEGRVSTAPLTVLQGQTTLATQGSRNVTTAYGTLTTARTTLGQGSKALGTATTTLGDAYRTTLNGKIGQAYVPQNKSNLTTTYGALAHGQGALHGVTTGTGNQHKSTHSTLFGVQGEQSKGKTATNWVTARSLYGQASKKVQIVNLGDGKIKIIDSNGKTKVVELKKGGIYEIEGDSIREVKPQTVTTGKPGTTSFFYTPAKGSTYQYYFKSKEGAWQLMPSKDAKGSPWQILSPKDAKSRAWQYLPGQEGKWRLVPSKDYKGVYEWIIGPDGKIKKADPPAKSEDDKSTDETLG